MRRALAMELVWAALGAVNPARVVARHVRLETQPDRLWVGDGVYDLVALERIVVVGAGKAGGGMAAAVEAFLGQRIDAGWVNVAYGYQPAQPLQQVHIHPAGHPLPDKAGLGGTRRILSLLDSLTGRDLAIVLLSGGASALLVQPLEGISLEDLGGVTELLLRSGAAIQEVNSVRKHLSRVKGGRLAQRIADRRAQAAVLVLSDVVGSPLDVIGSGPCAPDPTSFAEAWAVLERYDLLSTAPASVRDALERGCCGLLPETPKPGDLLFDCVHHVVVAENRTAALAAAERAEALGFHSRLLTTALEGEAREAGAFMASLARELDAGQMLPRPACLVLGGETTVTVRGVGQGGRNQEAALAAALALEGLGDMMIVTLATDGIDGPTDAAGAIVSGDTAARCRARGLDPEGYLARNDAYSLFSALGDLIVTGPSGTNVNDLAFVLAF